MCFHAKEIICLHIHTLKTKIYFFIYVNNFFYISKLYIPVTSLIPCKVCIHCELDAFSVIRRQIDLLLPDFRLRRVKMTHLFFITPDLSSRRRRRPWGSCDGSWPWVSRSLCKRLCNCLTKKSSATFNDTHLHGISYVLKIKVNIFMRDTVSENEILIFF